MLSIAEGVNVKDCHSLHDDLRQKDRVLTELWKASKMHRRGNSLESKKLSGYVQGKRRTMLFVFFCICYGKYRI